MIAQRFAENKKTIVITAGVVFVVLLIIILYFVIKSIIRNVYTVSSPGNIIATQRQQNTILNVRWSSGMQTKQGISTQFTKTPQPQQLLINTAVFATRLTGFLGPYESGVFDEDNATRLALKTGSRCLVLEIDYEHHRYEPKLIYRDGWGMKKSINTGSIQKVAKCIAARAFTPQNATGP